MSAEHCVGIGYDTHRYCGDRTLILGGVQVPGVPGLQGHSDADVLTHAIIDAVLGAAGLGDIGHHFPDTDPRYEGANSLELLGRVVRLAGERGWSIGNVDVTMICEQPRIASLAGEIAERLGVALGIPAERVNVKGTTNEGMGFVGRGEGMAAIAVALLERP
jgi:2-C-methyl-D-erythritol 2,4-cyclodiphosphate synthase